MQTGPFWTRKDPAHISLLQKFFFLTLGEADCIEAERSNEVHKKMGARKIELRRDVNTVF